IATVKDSQLAGGTQTKVAGSFQYMAPEQFWGQPAPSSDIYALGIIAYEMATGRRPFLADSLPQLMEMQREGVKVRPKTLCPELPETAQDVILEALSFDPQDRPARARDFGDKLAKSLVEPQAKQLPETIATPSLEMAHVLFMDL